MGFLLRFIAWATPAFLIAWSIHGSYERTIAAMGAGLAAPPGAQIELLDLELFYPFDLGVYVALCLASSWAAIARRVRAAAIGLPVLVAIEVAVVFVSIKALMAGGDSEAVSRFVDGIFRVEGLVAAAVVWLVLLGREQLPQLRGRLGR